MDFVSTGGLGYKLLTVINLIKLTFHFVKLNDLLKLKFVYMSI